MSNLKPSVLWENLERLYRIWVPIVVAMILSSGISHAFSSGIKIKHTVVVDNTIKVKADLEHHTSYPVNIKIN